MSHTTRIFLPFSISIFSIISSLTHSTLQYTHSLFALLELHKTDTQYIAASIFHSSSSTYLNIPIHHQNEMSNSSLEKAATQDENHGDGSDRYPSSNVRSPRSESTSLGVEDGDDTAAQKHQQYHHSQNQQEYNQFINEQYPPQNYHHQRSRGNESPAFLELNSGDFGADDDVRRGIRGRMQSVDLLSLSRCISYL